MIQFLVVVSLAAVALAGLILIGCFAVLCFSFAVGHFRRDRLARADMRRHLQTLERGAQR